MCFVSGRRPGVARHASNFLSLRRKKVTKERATLLRASLRYATGNLRCSVRVCAAELTARCALRSNNCGKSVHEVRVSCGTRTHTLPCASRHAQKGTRSRTSIRAFASLGRACAARGACARKIGPSEAKARVAVRLFGCLDVWMFGCLDVRLSTPCWLRLRRGGCGVGMGACAPMPRHLTRRGCPSGARQRKASSTAHPATAPTQVCPVAKRRGRRLGAPFLW